MAEINPDPYKSGDPLGPTGRMTAIFGPESNLKTALSDFKNAGFRPEDTDVFIGTVGEAQLDADGTHRGIEGLKMFQNAVCDEGQLFDEFDDALKRGDAVVAISVENNENRKEQLVTLLKSHHARKINYWGKWHNEALG